MIDFYPLQKEHLRLIKVQSRQENELPFIGDPQAVQSMMTGIAIAAWRGSVCLGAAGVIPIWENRGTAWAILSEEAGRHLVAITRRVRDVLDSHPLRRIETTVEVGFEAAERWAEMLGMRSEGLMKAFMPDGNDAIMFAHVKGR